MRLWCVDDRVPEITLHLLDRACAARAVEFVCVRPGDVDPTRLAPLDPGSLLYRPAVSAAAIRLEQSLFGPGVATFYADADGPHFAPVASLPLFERAGLAVPRYVPCFGTRRDGLRQAVEVLGGLPVVIKLAGGEGGVGVLRVDSWAALFSTVDYLLATQALPMLLAYVADAVPWRVVVVGERAVASYPLPLAADDFRSTGVLDAASVQAGAPEPLESMAVAATRALRLECAGVDLLWHASGRVYLLEANFPCYFAPAQELGGIDVAGKMIDHLAVKSKSKS